MNIAQYFTLSTFTQVYVASALATLIFGFLHNLIIDKRNGNDPIGLISVIFPAWNTLVAIYAICYVAWVMLLEEFVANILIDKVYHKMNELFQFNIREYKRDKEEAEQDRIDREKLINLDRMKGIQ